MTFVDRQGTRIHWRTDGEYGAPPIMLLNSIGTDISLWDRVLPFLKPHFQVIRMDMRGHGASDAPEGDYALATFADDAFAVLDMAGIARAHIAGVSLGGMVAMRCALDRPERVTSLSLICTSSAMDRATWSARIDTVRRDGTSAIADMAVGRFLSPTFAGQEEALVKRMTRAIVEQSDAGYAGAACAIRDMNFSDDLGVIVAPTLVVTGTQDISTPYHGHGDRLVSAIGGAAHLALPCAHLPPLEAPEALATALIGFSRQAEVLKI
ncbi:3-oxoadipate enol-lactonase [Sphingobium sp. WCS2017Hpa-17]|uniref:3-oxoadipate enol-lactonase n=1 Tax=Sphingobium sp. WCS2017Hpa-17 TaxID=3073638 RepID=UPI00288BE8BF|nr:3-oxoadipate enol-lactonase [Sphingobium sp. WCS2017Hpa-17]